jgi:peptide/nickel transport system substrate-binding protein
VLNARLVTCLLLGSLLLTACAGAPSSGPGGAPAQPQTTTMPQRTLVMAADRLPVDFAGKGIAGGLGSTSGTSENIPQNIFNATLVITDERGRPMPYLADALPQLDTNTWKVFPDGTMETTYRLKPNLVWHDGRPLTADDFTFSWQVYSTPAYGVSNTFPIRYMSTVEAPDPLTVVIRWKQRWVEAGILGSGTSASGQNNFPPLPRHILEQAVQEGTTEGEKFLPNSSFWNVSYIGAGPYKVDSYTPSVSIEASAFDAHVLGRPKIDHVSIRGISDVNASLATMLAGDLHYGADLFRAEEGLVLERDWVPSGKGVVDWELLASRQQWFQLRPDRAQPAEMLDVRVRRAIVHSWDKKAVFDAVTAGHGLLSDTFTSPNQEYQHMVDREVMKYPHDPRRAQQLLEEVGYTRDANGMFVTPRGEAMDVQMNYTGGTSQFEQETAILVDQMKQAGINGLSRVLPTSASTEDRALLPGIVAGSGGQDTGFLNAHSINIATAANRWNGSNRAAYSNPEFDRLANAFDDALNPTERIQLIMQMEKIISTDLPTIFMYYHGRVWAHDARLKGPGVRLVGGASHPTSTIYKWEWTS